MMMRAAAVVLVFLALLTGMSGLVLAIHGNSVASSTGARVETLVSEVKTLLLDGKTASAKSAKKTASEVETLLTDHTQSAKQQRELASFVSGIERHLDRSIKKAVDDAALSVAKDFGR